MHRLRLLACVAAVVLLKPAYAMPGFDAFSIDNLTNQLAIAPVARVSICPIDEPSEKLTLHEAITRILCRDPAIRQAWSAVRVRAAQLNQRKSAYRPRLEGRLDQSANHSTTRYDGDPVSVRSNDRMQAGNLSLSWILLDFGRREAALAAAQQLLAVANSDQTAAIQSAFLGAAQLYFAAWASNQRLAAARQVMDLAKDNYIAADEKYKAGAATLSDRLRAQTAYTQASLRLSREQGASTSALGSMALRMGLHAETALHLDDRVEALPALNFMSEVEELIRMASNQNPSLAAAESRVKAAQAAIKEARAIARPSIALTSSLGLSEASSRGPSGQRKDMSIGLQLNIPLFSGLEQTYRIRAAQAQAATYAEEAEVARLRVSVDVWTQYNGLRTEAANLAHTSDLVDQSRQAMDIVQGRYQSGVGNMTEVLSAMETYASAQEQHINAQANWQLARVGLAVQLGRLEFSGLE